MRHAIAFVALFMVAAACGRVSGSSVSGSSQSPIQFHLSKNNAAVDMQLVSGEAGWALDANALLLSRDGGGSWQPITPAGVNAAEIDTAFFLNLGVGWIVSQPPPGSEIEFYRTKNTGTSWQRLSVIPVQAGVARATHLVFVDEQHGWLVVDEGS
ncbi:MAG TPA: hypothetical protein VNA65_11225, partial [Candidatus Dormibacteraeota bacterium]|nr:hypothetical protein [Candidatus Dormibacteraeota bacterium]